MSEKAYYDSCSQLFMFFTITRSYCWPDTMHGTCLYIIWILGDPRANPQPPSHIRYTTKNAIVILIKIILWSWPSKLGSNSKRFTYSTYLAACSACSLDTECSILYIAAVLLVSAQTPSLLIQWPRNFTDVLLNLHLAAFRVSSAESICYLIFKISGRWGSLVPYIV